MRNRPLVIATLIAVFAAMAVYGAGSKAPHYWTAMTGAKEVPPVETKATGQATFTVSPDARSIRYTVTVIGIMNPTLAHIHAGAPGKNGPVVVVLYPVSGFTPKGNVLASGVITSSSLVGPLKGKTIADLLKAVKSGNTYVNVHTKAHPDGEIRGWIVANP